MVFIVEWSSNGTTIATQPNHMIGSRLKCYLQSKSAKREKFGFSFTPATPYCNMYLQAIFLLLLCTGIDAGASSQPERHARASEKCNSFVDGPFGFCSKGGYNTTFEFPDILTDSLQEIVASRVQRMMSSLGNCSRNALAETLMCSFFMPQCSEGKRVYPCKRVCGEFMKQCGEAMPVRFVDYAIANCHVLPDESASSGKCFEPPNFKTNDSIKGELGHKLITRKI